MQVVLDTNVLISFLLTRGETIGRILDAWEDETFTVCVSPLMLAEMRRVLEYPHLKERIKSEEAQALLNTLETDALLLEGVVTITGATTDPKDDMVVACAVEGKADYIVSGDPHLLKLKRYDGVQIVAPAEFVEILKGAKDDNQSQE